MQNKTKKEKKFRLDVSMNASFFWFLLRLWTRTRFCMDFACATSQSCLQCFYHIVWWFELTVKSLVLLLYFHCKHYDYDINVQGFRLWTHSHKSTRSLICNLTDTGCVNRKTSKVNRKLPITSCLTLRNEPSWGRVW